MLDTFNISITYPHSKATTHETEILATRRQSILYLWIGYSVASVGVGNCTIVTAGHTSLVTWLSTWN